MIKIIVSWPGRWFDPGMRKKIVVPLDGSSAAEQVLDLAVEQARALDGELILLHALSFPDDLMWLDRLPWPRDWPRLVEAEAQEYLQRQKSRLSDSVPIQIRVEAGAPARAIDKVARQEQAALIVVGARPRNRFPSSRVAHQLVELAPCPILVCPLPDIEPMEKAFEEFKV